ncbi:nucleotidyltransferase domain-containing protein [Paractinoplanes toevensis]|uniref:Polymerase nucleotidyl transferase domain-containing protein n=1 Tax=Paractinoplanes toevensis TaxID=571911 RepID=A0A919TCZ9_9ACTN|nr:nucleotidyltransferase domain-containing protein [Actinoplanes toevensis]GIM93323.1 hypothetical protein Ato02nite_051160 [Actinoplanes toevensis]
MIDKVTNTYLELVDCELPGFVQGLYLVGSAALDAWQPRLSDIDTIILTASEPTADDLAVLDKIHQSMATRPYFDAVYVPPALATAWPTHQEPVPFVVNGVFRTGKPCGELTPVVWQVFRRYGVRVRGPEIADLDVGVDPGELLRYNLDNLRDYWQASVVENTPHLAALDPAQPLDAETVVWFVTGPARLHHTAATGDIISKAAAANYLAELFPQHADLARRAAAFRAGEPAVFTLSDLREAFDSVNTVADDAWRRFGTRL